MTRRLRSLLLRLGVGERRWIPEEPERGTHRELVRSRLPRQPGAGESGRGAAVEPGEPQDPGREPV